MMAYISSVASINTLLLHNNIISLAKRDLFSDSDLEEQYKISIKIKALICKSYPLLSSKLPVTDFSGDLDSAITDTGFTARTSDAVPLVAAASLVLQSAQLVVATVGLIILIYKEKNSPRPTHESEAEREISDMGHQILNDELKRVGSILHTSTRHQPHSADLIYMDEDALRDCIKANELGRKSEEKTMAMIDKVFSDLKDSIELPTVTKIYNMREHNMKVGISKINERGTSEEVCRKAQRDGNLRSTELPESNEVPPDFNDIGNGTFDPMPPDDSNRS